MFSGLVKGTGRIAARTDHGRDRRFVVDIGTTPLPPLVAGGSIAVNGVCLTALEPGAGRFAADVSGETLSVTTLGRLAVGDRVNLEPPLRAGDPLDGHLVTGHVDGVGEVIAVEPAGRSVRLVVELPSTLGRYVAPKGSVAIDGVSLTVNAAQASRFEVNIIPHTQDVTVIGEYRPGRAVNIEVDLIARYLERLMRFEAGKGVDRGLLERHGYVSHD